MTLSHLVNRAKMSVTGTPGTGAITLNAAVTGFQTFTAAGIVDGDIVSYAIEDGSNWEIGVGTYTASGTSLARTTVSASSNSNSAISATSAALVYATALAADLQTGQGQPSGRLTLTTATPVLTATVSGATTVYFTPYNGNRVPVWNGSNWIWTEFTELSQATSDTTKSPLAVAASKLYDVFLWSDSGTLRATRGPAWSSGTARGTGAGTSELQIVNGFYCNKNSVTNGPAAGYGLYLGSIASNGSSTIDYIFGASASGGTAAVLNVWNYFNRRLTQTIVTDSGASYTYTTATIRAARASNTNRITWLSGLAEDGVSVIYSQRVDTTGAAAAFGNIGIALDVTNAFTVIGLVYAPGAAVMAGTPTISGAIVPQLGQHFLQAAEKGDGTNANTFDTSSLGAFSAMIWN